MGRSSWPVGLAKRLTVPFVARRLRCLQASVLERCRRVIALSDYSVRNISRLGVRDKRVVEIPGGVDLERFGPRPSRPEAAAKLGLPGDRRIVLTVRRLAGRMGLEELIRAMPDVIRLHPDVLLVVVGKGDLRGALEGLSRSAGVAEAVLFTGFAPDDDLPLYYRAAELFVLPTRSLEGFGLVTLEALSSGMPVVGTPTGATPEILRPLEESLVMAGCTSEDIAGAISGALSRNDLEDLGRRARRYVEENFSWQRAGHALLDVIAEGRPGAH